MTESDVRRAYVRMREVDNTIPDEVLDLMRDADIEKLRELDEAETIKRETPKCGNDPETVPFGHVRLACEYDERGNCVHCKEGMPL